MRLPLVLSMVLSVATGLLISVLNAIAHWHETTTVAVLIFLLSFFLACAAAIKPWLIAGSLCLTILLLNEFYFHTDFFPGTIIAAVAGAYIGFATRHL
jgi:hypothetical protein